MSHHSDIIRLRHMLDHAREAVELTQGKKRGNLDDDRLLQLGLVRLVEILGEAAGRVSKEFRGRHPSIPWEDVVSMRNKLIHEYDRVDLDILWDTVTDDLPRLIKELEKGLPPGQP
ncbi:MAG: DUF86 domain-containing protein [Nitrospinota bacterium]